jgi:hypothetical protein
VELLDADRLEEAPEALEETYQQGPPWATRRAVW